MRLFLLSSCLILLVVKAEHTSVNWHQEVGIKNAERIREYEDSLFENERIVGGVIAHVAAHPYLVGLLIDLLQSSSVSACGGSLLNANRILTAAHCWFDGRSQAWRFTAVLGSPFLFHGGLRLFPDTIFLHPEYDSATFANDIAILNSPITIPFSEHIRPIKLPQANMLYNELLQNGVIASGFGRYSDLTLPTTNTVVRNVILQVIPLEVCRAYYGNVVLDSNICTNGFGGVGICQGDSGGPLTVMQNGEPVLIGVSSFVAQDGCELGYPSVFARVFNYLDWINMHL